MTRVGTIAASGEATPIDQLNATLVAVTSNGSGVEQAQQLSQELQEAGITQVNVQVFIRSISSMISGSAPGVA
ncbi:MAG: hypothetical protein HRU34_11050 [Richelia sp.]|nr:hypothetical protein [Richelia sp.]CDN12067.1 hypothetical protein RintRC_2703 [Richelia intracellularis]